MISVSPLYAGLVALLLVALSFRVIQSRRTHGVSIGDGGEKMVIKRMRVQANCAEYAPIGIILLVIADLQGAPVWLLHVLGATLLTGRLLHAYGLGSTPQVIPARKAGMYLTFGMIVASALTNIGYVVF